MNIEASLREKRADLGSVWTSENAFTHPKMCFCPKMLIICKALEGTCTVMTLCGKYVCEQFMTNKKKDQKPFIQFMIPDHFMHFNNQKSLVHVSRWWEMKENESFIADLCLNAVIYSAVTWRNTSSRCPGNGSVTGSEDEEERWRRKRRWERWEMMFIWFKTAEVFIKKEFLCLWDRKAKISWTKRRHVWNLYVCF